MKWSVVVEKDADRIEVSLRSQETDEETDYVIVLEWSTMYKDDVDIPEHVTRYIDAIPTEAFLVFSTTIADLNSGKRNGTCQTGVQKSRLGVAPRPLSHAPQRGRECRG